MKLTSLSIEHFRQFKDFRLDLTDPKTCEPLEKVCFIGPNGTGKSMLLTLIASCCFGRKAAIRIREWNGNPPEVTLTARDAGNGPIHLTFPRLPARARVRQPDANPPHQLDSGAIANLLTIYCPPEGEGGQGATDPGSARLNDALNLLKNPRAKHVVSRAMINEFWLWVVAHIKNREKEWLTFQDLERNSNKTIAEIKAEFDCSHPQVLDGLSDVWDRILSLADLEFDRESVEAPVQLTDSLKAYLRTRSARIRVPYHELSTGIRNYLFRLGHIWSLYFNRPPADSILLVDEPEGSLYPDFLYDIVKNYRDVAPGCQLFMATHSPIVAAQFKREERIILDFGEDGYVTHRSGASPEGDDPNDILRHDFGIRSLMTEVGEKAWQRFLNLRRLIRKAGDPEQTALIEEYSKLQSDYHFEVPGTDSGNGTSI